jgi:hypothetical protein
MHGTSTVGPGHDDDLEARIAALRSAVQGLGTRRDELRAAERAVGPARAARDAAEVRATAAGRAAAAATLPSPRAWWALVTGRYAERRDAAAAAARAARAEAGIAAETAERAVGLVARRAATVEVVEGSQATLVELVEARALARLLMSDDPRLREVRTLEAELAAAGDQTREVDEARGAVRAALAAVDETLRRLGSAHAWGTYDTFFGGGLLSSAVKHDRIDAANASALGVRRSLERVRAELADVRMDLAVTHLEVDGVTRALDVWFDNVFSDWAVQSQIKDQQAAVGQVGHRLVEVLGRLDGAREELDARLAGAAARRRALLAEV